MPNYTGPGLAQPLNYNREAFFWNNEIVTAPQLSVAFRVQRIDGSAYPWGLSAEVIFGGNPGAFEIDIMGANTDDAGSFIQLGSITANGSTVAGKFGGRYDMASNLWPTFVAGYVKTLTNAVAITLRASR